MPITEILLTPNVLMLSAAIVALLSGLGTISIGKDKLRAHWVWRNLLPVLPLVLGVGGAFMPGVICDPGVPSGGAEILSGMWCGWGTKIVAGLWAGFIAAHGFKIFKRIVVDRLRDEVGDGAAD